MFNTPKHFLMQGCIPDKLLHCLLESPFVLQIVLSDHLLGVLEWDHFLLQLVSLWFKIVLPNIICLLYRIAIVLSDMIIFAYITLDDFFVQTHVIAPKMRGAEVIGKEMMQCNVPIGKFFFYCKSLHVYFPSPPNKTWMDNDHTMCAGLKLEAEEQLSPAAAAFLPAL